MEKEECFFLKIWWSRKKSPNVRDRHGKSTSYNIKIVGAYEADHLNLILTSHSQGMCFLGMVNAKLVYRFSETIYVKLFT